MDAQPDAGADREDLVRPAPPTGRRFSIWASRCGSAGRKVVGLREVPGEVVEFPDVLARVPGREPGAHREPRRERSEGRGDPAVAVDGAAAVVVEVLGVLAACGLRVVERVGQADAVDRVLHEAVDDLRRVDADELVDGRRDVVHMMELGTRGVVGLDPLGPRDGHRVARSAEMRGDELGVLERRIAGPRPAGVIHVVGLRRAERVEAAYPVQRLDLLLDGVGDLVLREKLADRAVLTLGARAVVAEDVEDERVVAHALALEFVDHLAGLHVDMLDEPGEDFHQPALERALALGNAVPRRHGRGRAASIWCRRESSRAPSGA